MEWLQVVVLAIVQGLTEFLPVSSSAHLILVPVLTNWQDQGLAFDVALHLGSLSAVLAYFRREVLVMLRSWLRSLSVRGMRELDEDGRLAWAVIFATIPVGLAGLLLRDVVADLMRSPVILASGLIVFGVLLGWADWRRRGQRTEYQINWRDVLFIGGAQALALLPGTSRSGVTITAALLVGMSREGAARFSFLLSIPVIALACALEMVGLVQAETAINWPAISIGIALSALSAYLCIHYFIAFIQRIGMMPFVAYRLVLGLLLLWIFS